METNQQEKQALVQKEKAVKRVQKPRIKKEEVKKQTIQQETIIQEEQKEEIKKQEVIIGIDPGFVKLAFAVISFEKGELIETICVSLRPEKTKLTQSQVEASINKNLKKQIDNLYEKYDIKLVVIELQLGNFSCTPIQTSIVANLRDDTQFVIQHSKLKLKHPEAKSVQNTNTDSKQYNQNKQMGRLLAQEIYKDFKENNYDQCDALLHALYVFRNKDKIAFVTKDQATLL